jgi:hypothetical protein
MEPAVRLTHYGDFLRFVFSRCFTEPSSTTHIDQFLAMGLETTPEVLPRPQELTRPT